MLHPARGPEAPVVVLDEVILVEHVVVEDPAVIDHTRDHADAVGGGGGEHHLARPRLQGAEDDHGPVDQLRKALHAADQIQCEAVGGSRRHSEQPRQSGFADVLHALPHRLARVAGAVRVV